MTDSKDPKAKLQSVASPEVPDYYNNVFDRLVTSHEDTRGLLAYAVYKQEKYDWIQAYRKKHKKPPKSETIESYFLLGYLQDRKVEDLFHKADKALLAAGRKIVEQHIQKLDRDYAAAEKKLTKKFTQAGWLVNIGYNLASAFVFIVLATIFYLSPMPAKFNTWLNKSIKERLDVSTMANSRQEDIRN